MLRRSAPTVDAGNRGGRPAETSAAQPNKGRRQAAALALRPMNSCEYATVAISRFDPLLQVRSFGPLNGGRL